MYYVNVLNHYKFHLPLCNQRLNGAVEGVLQQ